MSANHETADHQPKLDHNRRLALGIDPKAFAAEAGISVEQLTAYEETWPTYAFDLEVANLIGRALHRLESAGAAQAKVYSPHRAHDSR